LGLGLLESTDGVITLEYSPFLPVYILMGFFLFCATFLLVNEFKELTKYFRSEDQ